MIQPPVSTLFPYTTLFRSPAVRHVRAPPAAAGHRHQAGPPVGADSLYQGAHGVACAASPPAAFLRAARGGASRSEEHTSELQSRRDLVCRLLLEKKKLETM